MIEDKFRVGIYGGTFAPIHRGHVESAQAFMKQMKLDYLYVIPTYIPPHKEIDASDSPIHRLRMCEQAFAGIDGVIVSDIEIRRGGRSYTYDTLCSLAGEDKKLFLLCGTDMVLTFDTWFRYEDILKMCYPCYVRRERDKIIENRIIEKITEYYNKHGVMFRRILTDPIEISSTEIREALAQGEDMSSVLPESVVRYIKEHGLYDRAKVD